MSAACIPEKVLGAYLDKSLPDARARQVQTHLARCSNCRQLLADLQQADDMIRALPSITPSAGFDAAFWRKVADLEERRARPAWFDMLFGGWRPVLVSASVVLLVAGIFLYHRIEHKPTREEIFMVENMEMLGDLELIQQLDMLEHWEDIQAMKEQS